MCMNRSKPAMRKFGWTHEKEMGRRVFSVSENMSIPGSILTTNNGIIIIIIIIVIIIIIIIMTIIVAVVAQCRKKLLSKASVINVATAGVAVPGLLAAVALSLVKLPV